MIPRDWIHLWRDEDHIVLETVIELGGGPLLAIEVASHCEIEAGRVWQALRRLVWRGVLQYGPELRNRARWELSRETRRRLEEMEERA
jgi:hypothetical protein